MAYKDKEKKKEYNKKRYQQNKEYLNEQRKEYREANKEKISEQQKEYYQKNKEKINERRNKHYQKNKEKTKQQSKEYYEKNKEKTIKRIVQRNKIRYQEDITYRITDNLRRRLRKVIKGSNKSARTMELLGCSAEQLRTHIEAQFTEGMTWDNYGLKGWHIDHIRPCASFDLTDPQQQLECFHYTNLQPLWAEDNLKKRDKYD